MMALDACDLETCELCLAPLQSSTVECEVGPNKGRKIDFYNCSICGSVFAPQNRHDYHSEKDFRKDSGGSSPTREEHVVATRCGDGVRWGREAFLGWFSLGIHNSTFEQENK